MPIKNLIRSVLPTSLLHFYHASIATLGAWWYGFPSKKLFVIGVTGTKGKTSTIEYLNAILEYAGYKTALTSTVRFKIDKESTQNTLRMSMPGRFFLHNFLARAVQKKCTIAIIEMTSEGAVQNRHKHIMLDALVFTNISPEHIESHGSFEAYKQAKLSIGHTLEHSTKRPRTIVANADDELGKQFLLLNVENVAPYSLSTTDHEATDTFSSIVFDGQVIQSNQPGEYNAENMLAAATMAHAMGIPTAFIRGGLESCRLIPGRAEHISIGEKQNFDLIVDYAHTPQSLTKLYEAFKKRKKICVLGNTGGGRDRWKRPEMARIAEHYCEYVILTDEDPYDENPESIIDEMVQGMETKPEIQLDRRIAIRRAIMQAQAGVGDTILITGKGADTSICRAHGIKEPWSDVAVAKEELEKLLLS